MESNHNQKKSEEKPKEYRFIISEFLDEYSQTPKLLFTIETTRVFRSFLYNILVKDKSKEKHFIFEIEGLSMNALSIPKTGPALFQKEFPLLKGEYSFTFLSINNQPSTFKLKFSPKGIKILQASTESFIELSFA